MKPKNWNAMTDTEKLEEASTLFSSVRGQYIVGQSLVIAAKVLGERGEESNAQDAEMLQALFALGASVELGANVSVMPHLHSALDVVADVNKK